MTAKFNNVYTLFGTFVNDLLRGQVRPGGRAVMLYDDAINRLVNTEDLKRDLLAGGWYADQFLDVGHLYHAITEDLVGFRDLLQVDRQPVAKDAMHGWDDFARLSEAGMHG